MKYLGQNISLLACHIDLEARGTYCKSTIGGGRLNARSLIGA